MALVTPSRVTITDVNTELTIPASTRTNIGNTWVHNVAAIPPILISTNTLDATTLGAVQSVTAPSDATFARLRIWGGGAGSSSSSPFGGGGGSGFNLKMIDVVGGSTVASCVVGLRGQPATTGTTGGTTTVTVNSVNHTATGGSGSTSGGSGGFGTNGDDLQVGGTGTSGTRPTRGGNAAGLQYGGGLGGLGAAGQTPGGGGGTSTTGANFGGHGRVIIDWYKSNIIRFSNLRWGINFPGVQPVAFGYRYANTANIVSSRTRVASTGFVTANGRIEINSNGILKYIIGGREPGVNNTSDLRSTTWLTSGVNSDYTANIVITGTGSFDGDSSPTNADLLLNTTRTWTITNHQPAPGGTTRSASGVMIIKNDGVEIFRRPWTMSVTATFINLFV